MAKVRTIIYTDGTKHHLYKCPGCGYEHAFSPNVHTFNGDMDKPTVSPSLLQSNPQNYKTCHSYINNGQIQFLTDCWHTLAGQTVELPDYPADQELLLDYSNRG